MTINNPYIDLVKEHPYIWTDVEKIYSQKWKWHHVFTVGNDCIVPQDCIVPYKRLYTTAEKALWNKATQFYSPSPNKGEGARGWGNFVLLKDYAQNINKIFWEKEIDLSYIFFPDPWGKKDRQKKHRLLQTPFLNDLYKITKQSGKCIIKTDHREYFDFVLEQVEETSWKILKKSYDWESEEEYDSSKDTEFQRITKKHTEKVNYLELEK